MRNFYFIISCLISLILMGCNMEANSDLSKEDRIANQLIQQSAARIGKKYGLSLCGIGGGDNNGIWLLSVALETRRKPVTKQEARELIVTCINEFLLDINASDVLRPYLKVFPFTAKNLEVQIFFYTLDGYYFYYPDIEGVSSIEGKILYFTNDPEDKFKYKSIEEETYDEAVGILRRNQKNFLL